VKPEQSGRRAAVVRLAALLPFVVVSACIAGDPELEVEQGGGPTAGTPKLQVTTATSRPAASAALQPPSPATPRSNAAPCPPRMIEVIGRYCTDLMHRCIKGGKTHTGEETEEPEPFYCDEYQRGFAKCLGREEAKHFCIDEFEAPNQEGAIPMVMMTWYEAKRSCEAQSKRLCRDDEWTLACEGAERYPYPYGFKRDRTACNIDHLWMQPNDGLLASHTAPASEIVAEVNRLSKRVPSGSMPRCRSPYGVMDMGGNVDEWAVNVTLGGKPYQSVFKGGHWVSGARNRCRPVTASHDETTAYYAEGFRCCADLAAASN